MEIIKANKKHALFIADTFKIFYKPEQKWSKEKIAKNIETNKKEYYLILDKDKPAGAMELKWKNQKNNVPPHTKVWGLIGTCFLDVQSASSAH